MKYANVWLLCSNFPICKAHNKARLNDLVSFGALCVMVVFYFCQKFHKIEFLLNPWPTFNYMSQPKRLQTSLFCFHLSETLTWFLWCSWQSGPVFQCWQSSCCRWHTSSTLEAFTGPRPWPLFHQPPANQLSSQKAARASYKDHHHTTSKQNIGQTKGRLFDGNLHNSGCPGYIYNSLLLNCYWCQICSSFLGGFHIVCDTKLHFYF